MYEDHDRGEDFYLPPGIEEIIIYNSLVHDEDLSKPLKPRLKTMPLDNIEILEVLADTPFL